MSKGPARRIRLRAVVAFPAVAVALVISIALVLTPFGPAQGMTLAALPTPTETLTATTAPPTTDATTVAPTTIPATVPTTVEPTTAAPTTTGPVPNPTPGPAPTLTPAAAGAPVDHHMLAWIDGSTLEASYLPVDAPALDASQFQTFRVRFQLHNDGTAPLATTPQLEYRPDGAPGFAVVPEESQPGIPLYIAREWAPSVGGGTEQGPLEAIIPVADFKLPIQVGQDVDGHHSMGANPDTAINLLAASYTEQEFTVRLSMDAKYLTGYELRVTNAGVERTGAQVARIVLGPPPPLQLSPGQREGVAVNDPAAPNAEGVVYPLMSAPIVAADPTTVTAVATADSPSAALYPLASGSLSAATVLPDGTVEITPADTGSGSPHDMAAAQCGTCHRGHTAKASSLLAQSGQSTLCFSCHNGTSAGSDVEGEYALARPLNNPAAREYYSHDEPTPSPTSTPTPTATESGPDEFGGVSNRRSQCADCHNSHQANGTDSIQTTDGWTASGRLAGVSGVSVENGLEPGSTPTYSLLSGLDTNVVPANKVTLEYQVCFKCHSGSTTLTSNDGLKPSKYALDKGIEFNPNNKSFHPIEAQGTNQTAKMEASLAGTSPYKLWNFSTTSTIRCVNCHASGTTPAATPPLLTPGTPPPPSSALAPHTSVNRGILLRPYKDRVLKPAGEGYLAKDFALCFTCHAEEPFVTPEGQFASTKTNFRYHGLHLNYMPERGTGGTDIDTAGDGQGNATCAECHFRLHSTTNKVPQDVDGSRLVNFAPNVKANDLATPRWTTTGEGRGTCSVTCHGYSHNRGYITTP